MTREVGPDTKACEVKVWGVRGGGEQGQVVKERTRRNSQHSSHNAWVMAAVMGQN